MTKAELRSICDKLEIIQWNAKELESKRPIYYARKILEIVGEFINNHSDVALECGSEWLYQSDAGLLGCPDMVGQILDLLVDEKEE